jgi:hypothetical protein
LGRRIRGARFEETKYKVWGDEVCGLRRRSGPFFVRRQGIHFEETSIHFEETSIHFEETKYPL